MGDKDHVNPLQIRRFNRGVFEIGIYQNMEAVVVYNLIGGDPEEA